MSKELLHTPEGVRDVYGKECARKLTIENKINNIFNLYDSIMFKHQHLNSLIFLIRKEVQYHQRIYISFLIGKEILWY